MRSRRVCVCVGFWSWEKKRGTACRGRLARHKVPRCSAQHLPLRGFADGRGWTSGKTWGGHGDGGGPGGVDWHEP
eukprot:9500359-Alexandrium_andersonii.AAC.1